MIGAQKSYEAITLTVTLSIVVGKKHMNFLGRRVIKIITTILCQLHGFAISLQLDFVLGLVGFGRIIMWSFYMTFKCKLSLCEFL